MDHEKSALNRIRFGGSKSATGPAAGGATARIKALNQRVTLAVAVVAAAGLLGSCAANATTAQTATTPTSPSSMSASSGPAAEAVTLPPSQSKAADSELARTATHGHEGLGHAARAESLHGLERTEL